MKKRNKFFSTFFALALAFFCVSTPFIGADVEGNSSALIEASAENDDPVKDIMGFDSYIDMISSEITAHTITEDYKGTLRFGLTAKDREFFRTGNEQDRHEVVFTIYRDSALGSAAIHEVMLLWLDNHVYFMHKPITDSGVSAMNNALNGNVSVTPNQMFNCNGYRYEYDDYGGVTMYYNQWEVDSGSARETEALSYYNLARAEGYYLDYVYNSSAGNYSVKFSSGTPTLYIDVPVGSSTADYFVVAEVEKKVYAGKETTGFWWWEEEVDVWETTTAKARSNFESVNSILKDMSKAGTLETTFSGDELTRAQTLAGDIAEKKVTVRYLERIENTPFAHQVESDVTVKVVNDMIFYDDVCLALGKKTLTTLGSTWKSFEKDSFDVYTAKYNDCVHLNVKSDNNKTAEAYFRLELSLEDFVKDLEDREIFEDGMFSFVENQIKREYPVIEKYKKDEIFGLWGYAVIPETMNWNTLFKDLIKLPAEYSKGIIKHYEAQANLNIVEYYNLCTDYGYTWYGAIFNTLWVGLKEAITLPANHYFVYFDPGIEEASIKEAGTSDVLEKVTSGVTGAATDVFTGLFSGIFDGLFGGLTEGGTFSSSLESVTRLLKAFGGLVIVVTLVIVGVWLYRKYAKNGKGKKK